MDSSLSKISAIVSKEVKGDKKNASIPNETHRVVKPHMGSWGCSSIIIGIVIGVSVFEVPFLVFGNVATPLRGLGAWLLGGILSLIGALCYAELATTYPKMGGDYSYLTKAFSPYVGYLFGWGRLGVMQTGSIGALAYVFANYANRIFTGIDPVWFAAVVVILLTFVNILGVKFGKSAQNLLTSLKVVGIIAIIVAGFFVNSGEAFVVVNPVGSAGFGFAMIMILYAFGGWNEAAFVAAEMRDPLKNIPKALIVSISAITIVYLVINLAYLYGLGFEGLRSSRAPAADILELMLGPWGAGIMSTIIVLSVLGALNGTILTGSRVYAAMGEDHKIFSIMGRWSPKFNTPMWSFIFQGAITVIMIFGVGTQFGQNVLDTFLQFIGLSKLPWSSYGGGFGTLIAGTAPVFWTFLLLTGSSLFVLRFREKKTQRVFSVPFFPILPGIFCMTCLYMLYSSIIYAKGLMIFGVALMILGAPFYIVGRKK